MSCSIKISVQSELNIISSVVKVVEALSVIFLTCTQPAVLHNNISTYVVWSHNTTYYEPFCFWQVDILKFVGVIQVDKLIILGL